jgi:peptidyl-prolyl cis-trans isomerase C
MKMFRSPTSQRVWVLAGCLSILLVVAGLEGCKKQGGAPQGPSTSESKTSSGTTSQTKKPKPDSVAVIVNGKPIMESQIDSRIMKEISARMGSNAARLSPEVIDQAEKMLRVQVIDVMVSETLLDEQIKSAGITTTDKDVEAAINSQGAAMKPPVTFDQYKKAMLERGADFNDVMATLRVNLARQKFVESKLPKPDVNEAQAKVFYDTHITDFNRPERVHASHILVTPDPNAKDPNQAKIAAKEKAQKLLAKLKEGADFAQLAKTDSNDPSTAPNGGDLGFFARGDMVKPFEDAAFALDPNKMSDVVETQFGYHIIKGIEHQKAGPVSFDEIKAAIVEKLTDDKRGESLNTYLQSLRAGAKIVYTSPADSPKAQQAFEEAPEPTTPTAKSRTDVNAPRPSADPNRK